MTAVTITAKGIINNKVIVVTCKKQKESFDILFNNQKDNLLEKLLNRELDRQYIYDGLYFVDRNSNINAYNVLRFKFFDKFISLDVEGEIETTQSEDGIIY